MGRKPIDPDPTRRTSLPILLFLGLSCCAAAYVITSLFFKLGTTPSVSESHSLELQEAGSGGFDLDGGNGECCGGIKNLELWGSVVKWGSDLKFNSSGECCRACKAMCSGNRGPCLCDSWVYCGDKEACGSKFGECWLKKQKDTLAPEQHGEGDKVMWTSGIIFGKGQGIVGLETDHGTLRIELYPDCAPHSVSYILELLAQRHCAGCHFYRAEGRGSSWDANGKHIKDASFGPPFAMIQGTLGAHGVEIKKIPSEACPSIRRGSVAWVGSGPEFFISLADHPEWNNAYTVFGSVLPEDMEIAERIARLPTKSEIWKTIKVYVLEDPVTLLIQRI